jgi:hypothetical protein
MDNDELVVAVEHLAAAHNRDDATHSDGVVGDDGENRDG